MKKILLILAHMVSYTALSQTYPCYPACDCDATYYDWNFDGICDSEDQTLHASLFSGNWIPTWEDQSPPEDVWEMPPHQQINSVIGAGQQVTESQWCNPVDVCISFDISGSISGSGTILNGGNTGANVATKMQNKVIVRQILYALYPGIVEGKVRVFFTSWADMVGNSTPATVNDIVYRLPQQLSGEIHFEWLIGITEMMFSNYNSSSIFPNYWKLYYGAPNGTVSGNGMTQYATKGLAASYLAMNQPTFHDPDRSQFIILVTDAKWPDSNTYQDASVNVATQMEDGTYSGSGTVNNVQVDVMGVIITGSDNDYSGLPNQNQLWDENLHMREITKELDGSDVAHLQNDIPYNPPPLPDPEVSRTSGLIRGSGDTSPNDVAVQDFMSEIQNLTADIREASGYNCSSCENTISHNGVSYDIGQIGDRCWFLNDLQDVGVNSINDANEWINSADGTPMSTNDPVISEGVSYNWYAVNQLDLCPAGWHVSDNSDWNNLEATLFGAKPHKLTKQSRTELYNLDTLVSNQFITEPFTVGLRENEAGLWRESETSIYWWTAEEYTRKPLEFNRQRAAWARGINGSSYVISRALWSTSNNKNNALRVRCVKDINQYE